jgi:hypothetical protein
MTQHHERERWLQDIAARQRNTVFPDTVQNEARFWRNLANPAFNRAAKIGLALFALFVFGTLAVFLVAIIREDQAWRQDLGAIALLILLVFGPVFAGVAWATRRTLRRKGGTAYKR